jgi:DNA-binding Xre family transcriptional regulator
MSTARESFKAEGEALRSDVDYRVDGFYFDIIENVIAAMERSEPKMTKSDLAAAMHVSPARVTNLMRGYKTNLEIRTIVQVAMALGVEPNDLCLRRKTREMLVRRPQLVPKGFVSVFIAEEKKNGKEIAA